MADTRKKYSKEFEQKAVELSNVRGNTSEIALELNIRAELIYRWHREVNTRADQTFSGNGKEQLNAEHKELARLRRQLADVKMDRDILKKAVSIFSVSDQKSTSS